MPTDKEFIEAAKKYAQHSPDPSRKTGCLIVREGGVGIAGCNEFPPGVKPRLERPEKYEFIEHAERNAIYNCARYGYALDGATIYLTWFPCAPCARALVCSGIKRLVGYEPDWTEERYGFKDALIILEEGGVTISFLERE